MNAKLTFQDRLNGCLIGAALGAEAGFARYTDPQRYETKRPADMFRVRLAPSRRYRGKVFHERLCSVTPLIDLGVRAYRKSNGRAVPEVFGALLARDEGVAAPAFKWDGLHTVQEILLEGMNPRLAGMGTFPSGLICGAMPAVGIYHFAHPDYAYLDGVELASTAQGRTGADWAGLCAAAVAAAFEDRATGPDIVDTVLRIAFSENRELYHELNWVRKHVTSMSQEGFLKTWHLTGGAPQPSKNTDWIAYNPLMVVLPPLLRCADDPLRMMSLAVAAPPFGFSTTVSVAILGAIVGAMHGSRVFPAGLRRWAEPIARPWFDLSGVVGGRLAREKAIIRVTEQLAAADETGDSMLRRKIRGCLLAGAIGNAMGSPVECWSYQQIAKAHPGGITTILDPKRLESEDDNQAAMLLLETYLAHEGKPIMARQLGAVWPQRLNRDKFYPYCMGHAYDLICRGWDPRIIGHWSVVTGSTVMCMEPVGLYHPADPAFARIDATAISYMYQRGLDVTAAAILAAAVAEAMRPDADVDSVCNAALDAAPRTRFNTFDRRRFKSCHEYLHRCLDVADRYRDVMAARRELYQKCLMYFAIDPMELLGLSLAMFKIADGDVRQAAIGGTNIGRDADSISGRAAMLAGTLRGDTSVPREWITLFKPASIQRIDHNADRMAALIVAGKLPTLKRRQSLSSSR